MAGPISNYDGICHRFNLHHSRCDTIAIRVYSQNKEYYSEIFSDDAFVSGMFFNRKKNFLHD